MNRRDFLEKGLMLLSALSPFTWLLAQKSGKAMEMQKVEPVPTLVKVNRATVMLVGDHAVGKTSIIYSYVNNGFPDSTLPAVLPPQNISVKPFGILKLMDTSQNVDYSNTDAAVVCYSVVSRNSFENACKKWRDEIRARAPKADLVLCGTKMDLRNNPEVLKRVGDPLTYESGQAAAKQFGFGRYVECSALNHEGLKSVFDAVIHEKLHDEKGIGWMRPN